MQFTYEQRFDNLLANSKISSRDHSFVESLKSQYLKKKYLSSGQDSWLSKLETKYAKLITGAILGSTEIDQRLKALKKLVKPNSWAAGFAESLENQNAGGRTLSGKQLQTLEKLEREHSPSAKSMSKKWFENYGEEQREDARICAEYYTKNPPYFADLAKKILENKNFIPTEKQWNAITQNKYAQKVLNNYQSKPRFGANSVVQLRKNARIDVPWKLQKQLRETVAFVIRVDVDSPQPCKGGRWYNVLFAGHAAPLKVMEKDLKPAKV